MKKIYIVPAVQVVNLGCYSIMDYTVSNYNEKPTEDVGDMGEP